jgi:hypothetical protein
VEGFCVPGSGVAGAGAGAGGFWVPGAAGVCAVRMSADIASTRAPTALIINFRLVAFSTLM